ncbi:metallophosphoesterase family protein [Ornithinibacillus xuwenensis]|uniref:DNA repair exonuclease n=1 Tax=Ornithinibacillus xuwenensis TaxID=3144668 RepID=A0ABU9XHI0_9BACI
MEQKISFIHAADLHLDSPFKGLSNVSETIFQEVRQSTFAALDNLVKAAIERNVDFVLLVGDLFDNEKQSLKAQIKLRNAFQELQRHHIEVYLSYGNHDYIKGNIYPITYPDNVHIFSGEQLSSFLYQKDHQTLAAIYGFSYENRAVTRNRVQEYQIIDSEIPFHIAMLHGSIESNTEHDTYAPFQLGELIDKPFHYWALGHIHKREILKKNPFVIYPGNIQGRNRKETGEKGCYYVEMSESEAEASFIPLQVIQYNSITIDLSACKAIHDIEQVIKDNLAALEAPVPQLVDLTLHSNQSNLIEWKNEDLINEIIDIINDTFENQKNWLHIFRYTIQDGYPLHNSPLKGDHFLGELSSQMEKISVNQIVSELFRHKEARKYIEALANVEEEKIKEEAFQLLTHELMKE